LFRKFLAPPPVKFFPSGASSRKIKPQKEATPAVLWERTAGVAQGEEILFGLGGWPQRTSATDRCSHHRSAISGNVR